MKKYDFNKPALSSRLVPALMSVNSVLVPQFLNFLLADIIGDAGKAISSRKAGIWIKALNENGTLYIDDEDKRLLIAAIEERAVNFLAYQFLEIFDN